MSYNFTSKDLLELGNLFKDVFNVDELTDTILGDSEQKEQKEQKTSEKLDKEQLLKECTEEIDTFTNVYGKLFKSFMEEGFTNQQAFRLVEIYAQNMLEAALW